MEKFFALIEKLKNLGIAAKLCRASNSTELREEWNKFLSENSELVEEIKAWGQEFANNEDSEPIFKESAVVEEPKEIAIIICICDDFFNVSECEVFEEFRDLDKALAATGEKVAMAVAGISTRGEMISEITAEGIFDYIQEENTDEDESAGEESGTDEAEQGAHSDDGEAVAEDTAAVADADTNYDA